LITVPDADHGEGADLALAQCGAVLDHRSDPGAAEPPDADAQVAGGLPSVK
jgi:hypothetical protein